MSTLDRSQLVALGLDDESAGTFIDRVEEIYARTGDTALCWQELSMALVASGLPFAFHEHLYRNLQARRDEAEGPLPVWMPSLAVQNESNLAGVMKYLGLATYEDLYRWSTANPEAYWGLMTEFCNIVFKRAHERVLDTSDGPHQPRWFPRARINIADSCFQADPDQTAIIFRRQPQASLERISYGELERLSNRVANSLARIDCKAGDAIAIDMGMTADAIAIYLGIVKAGCAVISIADSFTPREIATRLRIGKARAIFTMENMLRDGKRHRIYAKVIEAQAPRAVVLLDGESPKAPLREGDLTWTAFLGEDDSEVSVECVPHDTINILFSSGTTGDPKAIPWNHTTPIKCAADGFLHQDIKPGDVVCWPTNLGWMMGPWLIFASLINRAAIALFYDAPHTPAFTAFVRDAGVTMLGVVPSLVKSWRQQEATLDLDWGEIKVFSSTGECSNSSDMHFLMASAGYKPVIEYCGGTELGGAYLTATVVQPNAPATFSTPALGTSLVVLDEAEAAAEEGEVFLVPPSLGWSLTLLNQDHEEVYYKNAPIGPDGFPLRRHGDRIERLPRGYFKAHGRADDTMNLGGIKVSSAEIERTLKRLEVIDETAAIAVAPAEGGPSQLIVFAVVRREIETEKLTALLQATISRQLNPLFKIHETMILPALPRTASGKVMRRVLRTQYQHGVTYAGKSSHPADG